MQILNAAQIQQKIKRLAIEILEENFEEEEVILAGINNNGMRFARLLHQRLDAIADLRFRLTNIRLNPADPLKDPIRFELPAEAISGRTVIIIDDVANTGRTLFYACAPLMSILPKKVEMAVLVDRTHKAFPVRVDYMGISLATTMRDNITVDLTEGREAVHLD